MVLQEKVNVMWGTDGSNLMKIINEVANKYHDHYHRCRRLIR